MKSLDQNQVHRIEDYFFRKGKNLTADSIEYTYTITATFCKDKLETITIKRVKQINYFGWHKYFDTYYYTCETETLHSEHVPSNPYKEMQEKYILSTIEELMDTVHHISNNPE